MMAIHRTVVQFREWVRSKTEMIATDYSTVLSYLRLQEVTKSTPLLQSTSQVPELAADLNLTFLCNFSPTRGLSEQTCCHAGTQWHNTCDVRGCYAGTKWYTTCDVRK